MLTNFRIYNINEIVLAKVVGWWWHKTVRRGIQSGRLPAVDGNQLIIMR